MFNITILAIGKVKENYINTAIGDYLKRLVPYGKVKIEELAAEKFSERNHEQAKVIEGERIKAYLDKRSGARIIILDELGKMIKSVEFSQLIDGEQREIILVVGGSLGLADSIKKAYREHIALSALTLTHEMARLILVEQIYRGMTIARGKTYHY